MAKQKKSNSMDNESNFKEYFPLVSAVATGLIFLFLSLYIYHNLYIAGAFTIATSFLGYYIPTLRERIIEINKKHYETSNEINSRLTKIDNKLKNQLTRMLDQSALYTDENILEKKLMLLKKIDGPAVWVVSKFISKQISKNLVDFKFKINASEYSEFSSQIYFEPNHSLYITNSINFYSWFKVLLDKNKFDSVIENIYNPNSLDNIDFSLPPHIDAWNKVSTKKKRLVVLTEKELSTFFIYKPFYDFFLEITEAKNENDKTTKFILNSKFNEKVSYKYNVVDYDYAVFDEKVLLKWKNPLYNNDNTELEIDENFDSNSTLLRLFDDDYWSKLKIAKDITCEIKIVKTKIKRKAISEKKIDHKYSYYAFGAELWQKINKEHKYILGQNEQKYLVQFLKNEINSKYNIVHLGSGGGKEIKSVLDAIPHNMISSYSVIDISPDILDKAKETFNENAPTLNLNKSNFIIADLLDEDFPKTNIPSSNDRLFLLVSNGYLLSNDRVLHNINEIMEENDNLIITVENADGLTNDYIINNYLTEPVLQLFNLSLNIFDIDCKDPKYFHFINNNPDFIGYFKLKEWIADNPHYSDPSVKKLGDSCEEIEIFTSFKPNEKELNDRLDEFGFEKISSDSNASTHQVGGLFKKKK